MDDTAASVLARLKNKSKKNGRSYQLCLQLFCQEEFLRRLEKSKYSENLVLKGGLFIYSVTDFDSRVTVDVDFLLRRVPNTPEQLKKVLFPHLQVMSLLHLKLRVLLQSPLQRNTLESVLPWWQESRTPKLHSVLTLVWEMSSYRIRRNVEFQLS